MLQTHRRSRQGYSVLLSAGLVALSASIAACSGSATTSGAPSSAPGAASVAPSAASGAGSAVGSKVTLKLADDYPTTDPINTYLQKFADEVNQKSGGSVTIKLFENGQLGSENQIDPELANGAIQMSMVGVTGYAPLDAFFTPFAVKSETQLANIFKDNLLKPYFDKFAQTQHSRFIGTLYITPREMTSNKPISTVADLQGLKLRVPSNQAEETVFKALGAEPTILAFTEVYTALQTGTVQAQENPVSTILSAKFYEVQKYLDMTNHGIQPDYVFINTNTWNSLSSSQQTAITSAFTDVQQQWEQAAKAAFTTDVKQLQSDGMTVVQADSAAMRAKVYQSTVRPLLVNLWGESIVSQVEKLPS